MPSLMLNGKNYSGGGGGGSSYTAGDGISISNDEISTDNMSAADMAEVAYPLPGVTPKLMRYSTSEQMIGYWIDGKPIYQKVIPFSGTISQNGSLELSMPTGLDFIVSYNGWIDSNNNLGYTIPEAGIRLAIQLNGQTRALQIQATDNHSYNCGTKSFVCVYYTKTTDSALSA